MVISLKFLIIVNSVLLFLNFVVGERIHRLMNFRAFLITGIVNIHREELSNNMPVSSYRVNKLNEVSFHEAVWKFWRPVESFFDPSILDTNNEK